MIEIKFDYDDITITPKQYTLIKSRYLNINPFYDNFNGKHIKSHYPIITAPMDSVVNFKNMNIFLRHKIAVSLPRTLKHKDFIEETMFDSLPDFTFFSFGLDEFEKYYTKKSSNRKPKYVLIDMANGHMKNIGEVVRAAKTLYPNIVVMIGNIANPDTYWDYAYMGGVDLIRVGIGNGNGCLTTKQTGVGYPNASLINECFLMKHRMQIENRNKILPKIVADGGMKDYVDIIKALALGADYVMLGSILNKAFESSGQNYLFNMKISTKLADTFYDWNLPVKKQFYGMSTKIGQKKMGKTDLKTSEGIVSYRNIEYRLHSWIENLDSYLRSTMSYSDAGTLEEFIGKADYNMITENAFKRFNK